MHRNNRQGLKAPDRRNTDDNLGIRFGTSCKRQLRANIRTIILSMTTGPNFDVWLWYGLWKSVENPGLLPLMSKCSKPSRRARASNWETLSKALEKSSWCVQIPWGLEALKINLALLTAIFKAASWFTCKSLPASMGNSWKGTEGDFLIITYYLF